MRTTRVPTLNKILETLPRIPVNSWAFEMDKLNKNIYWFSCKRTYPDILNNMVKNRYCNIETKYCLAINVEIHLLMNYYET